jgi:peptide subunit release factor RF-3
MGANVLAVDRQERRVILFTSDWEVQYFERQHPEVKLQAESTTEA